MTLPAPARRELLRLFELEQRRLAATAGRIMAAAILEIDELEESRIDDLIRLAAAPVADLAEEAAGLAAATTAEALEVPLGTRLVVIEPDWRGPFTFGWGALGRGEDLESAIATAAVRADAAGKSAVVSSARQSAAASAPNATRWRRVTDPDPCEWCVLVARQTYASAEAADFGHDRCGCTVWPAEVAET